MSGRTRLGEEIFVLGYVSQNEGDLPSQMIASGEAIGLDRDKLRRAMENLIDASRITVDGKLGLRPVNSALAFIVPEGKR